MTFDGAVAGIIFSTRSVRRLAPLTSSWPPRSRTSNPTGCFDRFGIAPMAAIPALSPETRRSWCGQAGVDEAAMIDVDDSRMTAQDQIIERLQRIEDALRVLIEQKAIKDWYTTDEAAAIVGKAPFTVREWCRLG